MNYHGYEVDPSFIVGCKIDWKLTGNGEFVFGSKGGKRYFIKRNIHVRYPAKDLSDDVRKKYKPEADYLENNILPPSVETPATNEAPSPVAEPTPKATESNLTDNNGMASELQIKVMKDCLKKLKESDPSKLEWISGIAVETNGFKVVSRVRCEEIVKEANAMMNGKGEN